MQTPRSYLWIIAAFSFLVPKQFRAEWRREWEAEVINRWLSLERWEKLSLKTKLDMFRRVQGSFLDVCAFQQRRTNLVLVAFNLIVALLTGYGALQNLLVSGIFTRKLQLFLLSLAAMVVSILFVTSGIALLRQWRAVRRLIILTSALSVLLHVYGALPPHQNMGFIALLVGAGYGLLLLLVFEWNKRRETVL